MEHHLQRLKEGVGETSAMLAEMLENDTLLKSVVTVIDAIVQSYRRGGKLILFGNGGSAADAQHLAAEMMGRFTIPDRRALPAIALTTNTSNLTAIGNDFGFDHVFARQVEAVTAPEDVIIAISTSGRSPNVLAGIEAAKRKGALTVGLTGRDAVPFSQLVDLCVNVPSTSTPKIQEGHIVLGHIICCLVEEELTKAK